MYYFLCHRFFTIFKNCTPIQFVSFHATYFIHLEIYSEEEAINFSRLSVCTPRCLHSLSALQWLQEGLGVSQGPKQQNRWASVGRQLWASRNSVEVELAEEPRLYQVRSAPSRRGTKKANPEDCPPGWLLLRILSSSDSPDPSGNLCTPNRLVRLAHGIRSTEHSSPRLAVGLPLGAGGVGRCQAEHRDGKRGWKTGSVSSQEPDTPASRLRGGGRSSSVMYFQGL